MCVCVSLSVYVCVNTEHMYCFSGQAWIREQHPVPGLPATVLHQLTAAVCVSVYVCVLINNRLKEDMYCFSGQAWIREQRPVPGVPTAVLHQLMTAVCVSVYVCVY